MLLCAAGAAAAERLHGTVLTVEAPKHQVIVRHDAFDGMPGMTMAFTTDEQTLQKLREGNGIDADVDTKTEPWTLRNVKIIGIQPTVSTQFRTNKRLQIGDDLPNTAFIDQTGKPFTFAEAHGKYAVIAFIYTRCKDARMCPLISSKFAQLQSKVNASTKLYEVTLDPDFDRPNILTDYARTFSFNPGKITLLTGDPNAVLDFAAMFGLSAFADPAVGLIHNENTVIVSPEGKILETITDNSWSTEQIASTVANYQNLPSNPFARFELALSKAAVAVCGNTVAGFSGIADLAIVLAIFGAGAWLLFRLARGIARGST